MAGGLSGGNDADGVAAQGVGDGQLEVVCQTDGEEAILAVVLAAIVAIKAIYIEKNGQRLSERHAVFGQVGSGFFIVPFKVKT